MEKQTLEYYDWNDIQAFLCEELVICTRDFRDYHKVVGGDYKDLWHVWLEIDSEVRNGAYTTVYLDDVEYLIERLVEQFGDWVEVLKEPLIKLGEIYGNEDKKIVIYHYW